VTAGSRELERPARPFLTANVGEIRNRRLGTVPVSRRELVGRRRLPLAAQVGDRLRQVMQRHRLDPGERGFRCTLGRAKQVREPRLPSSLRRGEHAADRPQPAVQRELADCRVTTERLRWHLSRGSQNGQGDGQVEPRALLAQLRGRQVDRDPPHRPFQLRRGDAAADPFLRLLAGAVGQPDDCERRHPELEMRLDLDAAGV